MTVTLRSRVVWLAALVLAAATFAFACGGGDDDYAYYDEPLEPTVAVPTAPESDAGFLGGLFQSTDAAPTASPAPLAQPVPVSLPTAVVVSPAAAGSDGGGASAGLVQVAVGGISAERQRLLSDCNSRWRGSLLEDGPGGDYGHVSGSLAVFRERHPDCMAEVWQIELSEHAVAACRGVAYGVDVGPLESGRRTGWVAGADELLWVNFSQSPAGTGGGCWLYDRATGRWLNRSGDGVELNTLLTVFEVPSHVPGGSGFRQQALETCDHRLRAHLNAAQGPLDANALLGMLDEFTLLPGNFDCAGAGWVPAAVETSERCVGIVGAERPTGVYEDGGVTLHWSSDAVLGVGGDCWTYGPLEGAWFRSLYHGEAHPDGTGAQHAHVTPSAPGSQVGIEDGVAFETDGPVPGVLPELGDDAYFLGEPSRSLVCDHLMQSVILLNPKPRTPPDYAFLVHVLQSGVDGGVCLPERWNPSVTTGDYRDRVEGVLLPEGIRDGTGYDQDTGAVRVVFHDEYRPFDGSLEWIWVPGAPGWWRVR